MATQVMDVTTIIKALDKAEEDFLGRGRIWTAVNNAQKRFLELYAAYREDVIKMGDMKARASRSAAELNGFLAENGFDIRLEDFDPDEFGVVAILDRLVRWLAQADEEQKIISKEDKDYPAFRLEGEGVRFYKTDNHPHPIVALDTKSQDTVFLTFADQELWGLELTGKILKLATSALTPSYQYNGTVIPETLVNQKVDIGFLLGMATYDDEGDNWLISQALQQAKFAMNKEGAHIKVASAIAAKRGGIEIPKPDLVFNRPFLLWIKGREDFDLPIVAMYVDTDSWKEVKSIENL